MIAKTAEGKEQKENHSLLSVSWRTAQEASLQRPASPAPSSRTVVDDIPGSQDPRQSISRSRTLITDVHLTRWDRFRSIFMSPESFQDMITRRIHVRGEGAQNGQLFPKEYNPFILDVAVLPCPDSAVKERQSGRCVLDTGCFQGNIISAEFAMRLGYGNFQPLEASESNGGIMATGEVHNVSGAVHLTWYHNDSGKMFRDMRFLVSEADARSPFDIVIGSHSLIRDGIISPLNLMVRENGFHEPTFRPDRSREELTGNIARWKTILEDDDGKDKAKRAEKQKALKIAELDLNIFHTLAMVKDFDEKSKEQPAKRLFGKKEDDKAANARQARIDDAEGKAQGYRQILHDYEAERRELLGEERRSGSDT